MNGADGPAVTTREGVAPRSDCIPLSPRAVSYWSQGFPGIPSSDTYGQET